jgi:hypothetical protein
MGLKQLGQAAWVVQRAVYGVEQVKSSQVNTLPKAKNSSR